MRRIAAVTIICVLACLTIANAHESHNRILAEELLGAMEVQETIEKSFEMIKQMVPARMKEMGVSEDAFSNEENESMQIMIDLFMKEISWDNLKEDYISIYAETFTEEELKGLVTFYKSPVGRKFIKKQPELMMRTMEISERKMMELIPKMQELAKEMEEQEAARPACDE